MHFAVCGMFSTISSSYFQLKGKQEVKCINKYNDQICTLFEKVFKLISFFKTFTSFFALFLREKTGFVSNSSSEKCHGKYDDFIVKLVTMTKADFEI